MHPQVLISGLLLLLPAAVRSFPEVRGVAGHPVTLPCSYPVSDGISSMCWGRGECGNTCRQTLIWTDGHRVYHQTDRRYQLRGQLLQGDVSLTIENATERDSGLYCCRVKKKGWSGAQRLTTSLQVQPGAPTSSSRRATTTSTFKRINGPRTTPRQTRTTPRKLITTPRKPATTKKPTATTRRPSITPKRTTTPRRPTTTTKRTTTTRRPSATTKATIPTRRPSTTLKPTTTPRRPTTTTKRTTTTRRPSATTKATIPTRRPSTTLKPTTTPRRPTTTTERTTTTRRPSATTKATIPTRRPSTTSKPTTTERRSSATSKPITITRRSTSAPKSTRISTSTPPRPTDMQTSKPVYTETVTSSQCPCNKHTEAVPTPHALMIPTKGLYIGISVSVGLLLLTGVLMILKCRHMRKKKKPEISVVFHAYQNETFQSTVHPQTEDKFVITDDSSHSRSKP